MKNVKTNLISIILATLLLSGCQESSNEENSNPNVEVTIEENALGVCEFNEETMKYADSRGIEYEMEFSCVYSVIEYGEDPCAVNKEEPNEFITKEYCRSYGLGMMNTSSAYVAGASGEGVVVAIIDSRVEATHKEFENSVSPRSKTYVSSSKSHGTEVAGIIGANKDDDMDTQYDGEGMQGVAYNAEILSIGGLGEGGVTHSAKVQGINHAIANGADVINMSFGGYGSNIASDLKEALKNGVDSDMTFVLGAGNDSRPCSNVNRDCLFPASIPFLSGHSDLLNSEGGWIIVGAVDVVGEMWGVSNRAGVTKSHYVVALGRGAYTPTTDGKYATVDGTSFATPHVAGVVALMKDSFPHLSGKQIANVIFKTCTDLGEEGVDDVYGHGLVNVKKAFELAQTL